MLAKDLYLVENNDAFARILGMRFPGATIVHADAQTLNARLESLAGTVDYVISGLPIVWFDKDKKTRILDATFTLLKRGGALHQFTYLGQAASRQTADEGAAARRDADRVDRRELSAGVRLSLHAQIG